MLLVTLSTYNVQAFWTLGRCAAEFVSIGGSAMHGGDRVVWVADQTRLYILALVFSSVFGPLKYYETFL